MVHNPFSTAELRAIIENVEAAAATAAKLLLESNPTAEDLLLIAATVPSLDLSVTAKFQTFSPSLALIRALESLPDEEMRDSIFTSWLEEHQLSNANLLEIARISPDNREQALNLLKVKTLTHNQRTTVAERLAEANPSEEYNPDLLPEHDIDDLEHIATSDGPFAVLATERLLSKELAPGQLSYLLKEGPEGCREKVGRRLISVADTVARLALVEKTVPLLHEEIARATLTVPLPNQFDEDLFSMAHQHRVEVFKRKSWTAKELVRLLKYEDLHSEIAKTLSSSDGAVVKELDGLISSEPESMAGVCLAMDPAERSHLFQHFSIKTLVTLAQRCLPLAQDIMASLLERHIDFSKYEHSLIGISSTIGGEAGKKFRDWVLSNTRSLKTIIDYQEDPIDDERLNQLIKAEQSSSTLLYCTIRYPRSASLCIERIKELETNVVLEKRPSYFLLPDLNQKESAVLFEQVDPAALLTLLEWTRFRVRTTQMFETLGALISTNSPHTVRACYDYAWYLWAKTKGDRKLAAPIYEALEARQDRLEIAEQLFQKVSEAIASQPRGSCHYLAQLALATIFPECQDRLNAATIIEQLDYYVTRRHLHRLPPALGRRIAKELRSRTKAKATLKMIARLFPDLD